MSHTVPVLLVHGDETVATRCAAGLEAEGDLAVETVESADRALDRLAAGDIECVLSGYRLPDADGLELLADVRERFSDLPFVLLADAGDGSVAGEAMSAGATDCVRRGANGIQYDLLANRVANVVDRHRAREQIAEQRQRFRRILEQSSDLVTVIDREGMIVYESPSVAEILGYDPDERVGADALEPVHPDDREAVDETFASIVDPDGPETARVEYRYRAADGSWVWLESVASTQWDPSVEGYVVNSRDVTERQERERQLAEEREKYQRVVEQSDDGVAIVQDGVFRFVNDSLAEIVDRDPDDLVGESMLESVAPEDRELLIERYRRRIAGEEPPEQYDVDVVRSDGERRTVSLSVSRITYEGEPAVVANVHDVTERKEREQQLREEREKYSTLVEQSNDGVAIIHDGTYAFANESLAETLGRDPETLIGTDLLDTIAPEDRETVRERHRRRMAGEDVPEGYDIELVRPDGERRTAAVSVSTITYQGDRAALASVHDITDRKQREERLEQQRERLSEFASIVSHDLRNPLNVVRGRLELARQDHESDDVDTAIDALDRMERIIENTLTLARQGRDVTETRTVAPAALVDDSWAAVSTDAAELTVEPIEELEADPDRLRRLFENLFRNAVEHAGDDVSVRVGPLDDDDGFYVADDGPGIPEERRGEVFDAGRTTAADGTGLGLAIVRRIAGAHGWSIEVRDSADGGARFEIRGIHRPLPAD